MENEKEVKDDGVEAEVKDDEVDEIKKKKPAKVQDDGLDHGRFTR